MKNIKNLFNKYKVIITYIFSSGLSFIIDLIVFSIILFFLKKHIANAIIIASFLARALSSIINYLINKYKVFKYNKKNQKDNTCIQYFVLVIINITISSVLVSSIYKITKINETLIKTLIDCLIFIVNYFIQKLFIFKNKESKNDKIKFILPIFSFIALFVNLNESGITFNYSIYEYIIMVLTLPFLYFLYLKIFKKSNYKFINILAVIFTIFMILGYSYKITYSPILIYKSEIHILITLIKFIGYYFLIKNILNTIYEFIINHKFKDYTNKFTKIFNKHPFLFSVILLSIIYGIYLISYYPGIINYDNANQIKEVLGIPTRYLESIIVLDKNITLTNFNPIIHTLILGNLFKLGITIGNVNLGLFLFTIFQEIIFILTLAYSLYFLFKEGVKTKYLLIILLIYLIVPFFPYYAITAVKDTLYTAFMILYIIKLYQYIKYDFKLKDYLIFLGIMILIILFRNNGIFMIVLSLPFVFFIKKQKQKSAIILTICILVFFIGYNITLFLLNIPNTSIREALSVPFQQTARYVKDYENDVTEEEIKIIDKILNYDTLSNRYNPILSDDVKNEYNKYATKEDLKKYFTVWFKMFFKHPDSYINATLSNNYGYWYPNSYSWYVYTTLNPKLPEAGYDYHFNNLNKTRIILKSYANAYEYIPIIQLVVSCGFYTWIYLFLTVLVIKRQKKELILILLPVHALIFMCLIGPANTYFRYVLPYAVILPLILMIIIKEINPSIIKRICK